MINGNHHTPYQEKIVKLYTKLSERGFQKDATLLQLFSSEYQRG